MNRFLYVVTGLLTILSAAMCVGGHEATASPAEVSNVSNVESYKYAPEVQLSRKYAVEVEGIPVSVLTTAEPDYAVFGAKGEVVVKVTCLLDSPDSVAVRPIAKGYPYSLEGNVITLRLKPGDRVCVEPDYSLEKPLFIFVNELEARKAKQYRNDPNTIFFEAGKVHDAGKITPKTGQTVYIEGGAVVEGYICQTYSAQENITITGYGVLDARKYDGISNPKQRPVMINNCQSLIVENLVIVNADLWCVYFNYCDYSHVSGVKIIATFSNVKSGHGTENDGIDVSASQHVKVEGCFVYVHDDCYVIKSSAFGKVRLCKDISFTDCIGWNFQAGNTFEIGHASGGGVEDVYYKDIYSIHAGHREGSTYRRGGISIHCGAGGLIKNIHYDNVHIEAPEEYSFNISVFKPQQIENAGWIQDVFIDNLKVYRKAPLGGVVRGYDEEHMVSNVVFRNYTLEGSKVTSLENADITDTGFSEGIRFE